MRISFPLHRQSTVSALASIAALTAALCLVGSCASDGSSATVPTVAVPAPVAMPTTAVTPPAAVPTTPATPATTGPAAGSGGFDQTRSATCGTELTLLETALGAYEALNGSGPITEDDLVTAGIIRAESALYDIGAENAVVPAAGSNC